MGVGRALFGNSRERGGMTVAMYLRINRPKVILEQFDDEMVLVNLDSGSYYTIDLVGADIWAQIEEGAHTDDIVEAVIRRNEAEPGGIETAVREFVAELQREGLVVPDETREAESSLTGTVHAGKEGEAKKPGFLPPVLRGYTDMQDLILLDPIHEVDDSGWPNVKQPDPS